MHAKALFVLSQNNPYRVLFLRPPRNYQKDNGGREKKDESSGLAPPSLLEASKKELKGQLERAEKLSGSLYGKIASFEFGENEDFSIDALADALTAEVRKLQLG